MEIQASVIAERAVKRIADFQQKVAQRATPNRMVAAQLYAWTIQNYDSGGGKIGGWAPLHPRTVKQKARIGKEQIMVRTGALRQSFVPFADNDNAGIGSAIKYSKPHQFGDPSHNLPARPMLPPRDVVNDIGSKVYGWWVSRSIEVTQ